MGAFAILILAATLLLVAVLLFLRSEPRQLESYAGASLSPLAKDVAQAEYMARTFGIYLRSESYDKEVEKYVGKLAKVHGVSEDQVRQERDAYVKAHPLDWQRKDSKT